MSENPPFLTPTPLKTLFVQSLKSSQTCPVLEGTVDASKYKDKGDTTRDRKGMTWPNSGSGYKSHIYMAGTSANRAARTPTVCSIFCLTSLCSHPTNVLMSKLTLPNFQRILQAWFALIPISHYHAYLFLIESKWRRTLCLMKFHLAFNCCNPAWM